MDEFTAQEWFTITGRGDVAAIKGIPGYKPEGLLHRYVKVDGIECYVRGVEMFAIPDPTGRDFGLLVTKKSADAPEPLDSVREDADRMDNDLIERMTQALYLSRHDLPPEYQTPMSDVTQQTYERMARAALEAIKRHHWQAAPGDKQECPVCEMIWTAVEDGPLDIRWTRY